MSKLPVLRRFRAMNLAMTALNDVSAKLAADPVLRRYCAALEQAYGDRLDRVVLFGSRARLTAGENSDYDVAIFLKSMPDRWAELHRLADLRIDFLESDNAFFDAKPYPADAYQQATPLMREIRRDGIEL